MARTDGGAAVAVYHRGRLVVDMWGGVRTLDGDPWERDTLAMCWSTTKGVVATCAHVLADRGELDYDERVATYWPEFAQNGKGDITVRQVLSHSAGLHRLGTIIDHGSRILDWEHMTDALARAKPAYQPGTSVGYHALTFGWLVGELVRRISGIPIEKFVQKEIAEPLGLDGLYIGCPPEQRHRVAPLAPMGTAFKLWSDPIGGVRVRPADTDPSCPQVADQPASDDQRSPLPRYGGRDCRSPTARCRRPGDEWVFRRRVSRRHVRDARGRRPAGRCAHPLRGDGAQGLRDPERSTRPGRHDDHAVAAWLPSGRRLFTNSYPALMAISGSVAPVAFADPEHDLALAMVCNRGQGTPIGDLRILRLSQATARAVQSLG